MHALVRFFLDCGLHLPFTVVLYPEPFIISDILLAAFLLRLRPDSLARDFTASLKLTPLLATALTTFIPARSVSLPTALAPLMTYGRMRRKRPHNQVWGYYTHFSRRSRKGRGEDIEIRVGELT